MERRMMDTATAAAVVHGRLHGGNVRFLRVTTDTRALAPGDLFVALKGDQFDGHDFVATAFERGAAAALVAADRADALAGELVAVADPLAALGQLALHWRRQFGGPVIVIAGSNGKTTVKEMVASILREEFGADAVHATRGNFNNAIGLPLTVLGLRATHRAAAIELGMNHPGETAELAAIAQPTVAIVNNAQREHQEFMAGTAAVAQEHAALIRALAPGGTAVLNADDAHVGVWRDAARERSAAVVDFGLDHPAAVAGRFVPAAVAGTLQLSTGAGVASVKLAAPGRHNAANALAATAATLAAGVALPAVVRGLEAFRPVAGRLVTRAARNGAVVIDDTYNANPDSVRAAIGVLAGMPGPKCLVLGDMGEVGAQGPAFHDEIGAYARAQGIDRLLAVGVLAAATVAAFGAGALHFSSVESLAQHAEATIDRGTTVLVKGSRFMRMERVVAALTGEAPGGGLH
jgi:UDP-N-acetylmuramoyl-tripeptide--D-alanyl-D-alanine ligase